MIAEASDPSSSWMRAAAGECIRRGENKVVSPAFMKNKEFEMSVSIFRGLSLFGVCLALAGIASAQQPASASKLQTTFNQSAQAGKFTFVVFHRDSGEETRALYQQVQDGVSSRSEKATIVTARVDDPAERSFVEQFGISRAPMPMAVVVAPNGAITGLFPRALTEEQITAAIVPPTMMRCMKELQQNKLVFVCLTHEERAVVPAGVQAVQLFPEYKGRISLVSMKLNDPAEARFYHQMRIDPNQVKGPHAVLIAPPGVLVGHFTSLNSAEQIAGAIHKSGQCCEDPNCKHGQAAPTRSTPRGR